MTSLTKLSAAMLLLGLSSGVSAVELYKDDKSSFGVGGRFDVRYLTGGGSDELGDGASRIHFVMDRELKDGWKAIGHGEWGVKLSTNTKSLLLDRDTISGNGDDGSFFLRQGFVGFEHEKYGKLTAGKQWGTLYNLVLGNTDVFIVNGGSASGAYNLGSDGGFSGTARAEKAIQYTNTFGNLTVSAQFQANETDVEIDFDADNPLNDATLTLENFYAIAASYKTPWGIVIGAGINDGEYLLDTEGVSGSSGNVFNYDDKVTAFSVTYGSFAEQGFHIAVSLSDMEGHEIDNTGNVMDESMGTELITSYRFGDIVPYIGYNLLEDDSSGSKYELSYVAGGVSYFFDPQTFIYVEAKLDDSTAVDGSDPDIDDIVAFGMQYNF